MALGVAWRQEVGTMQAAVGDRIIIRGKTVETPDRHGKILEVNGAEGAAPYLVQFDDGHQSVIFPGTDFIVEHRGPAEERQS
jgi:hypothetical protein